MPNHTIEITGISDDLLERLDASVLMHGGDRSEYIRKLIERGLEEEQALHAQMIIAEILSPVHEYSRRMGYTDDELGEFVDTEIEAYRVERRSNRTKEQPSNA